MARRKISSRENRNRRSGFDCGRGVHAKPICMRRTSYQKIPVYQAKGRIARTAMLVMGVQNNQDLTRRIFDSYPLREQPLGPILGEAVVYEERREARG